MLNFWFTYLRFIYLFTFHLAIYFSFTCLLLIYLFASDLLIYVWFTFFCYSFRKFSFNCPNISLGIKNKGSKYLYFKSACLVPKQMFKDKTHTGYNVWQKSPNQSVILCLLPKLHIFHNFLPPFLISSYLAGKGLNIP